MTHHRQSVSEHGERRGLPGIFKRTAPDLLIGLALIYVGAISLSFMVDGYLRGVVHGILLVLAPALLIVQFVRSSAATAYVARWVDEDTIEVASSDPSLRVT